MKYGQKSYFLRRASLPVLGLKKPHKKRATTHAALCILKIETNSVYYNWFVIGLTKYILSPPSPQKKNEIIFFDPTSSSLRIAMTSLILQDTHYEESN